MTNVKEIKLIVETAPDIYMGGEKASFGFLSAMNAWHLIHLHKSDRYSYNCPVDYFIILFDSCVYS